MAMVCIVRPCWASLRIASRIIATAALKSSKEVRPSSAARPGPALSAPAVSPTAADGLKAGAQNGKRKNATPARVRLAKKMFPKLSR
jgi:hypothetical protein